jgi:hypothetical protein
MLLHDFCNPAGKFIPIYCESFTGWYLSLICDPYYQGIAAMHFFLEQTDGRRQVI